MMLEHCQNHESDIHESQSGLRMTCVDLLCSVKQKTR